MLKKERLFFNNFLRTIIFKLVKLTLTITRRFTAAFNNENHVLVLTATIVAGLNSLEEHAMPTDPLIEFQLTLGQIDYTS